MSATVCKNGQRSIKMVVKSAILRRQDGSTSVEYAVMLSLLIASMLVVIQSVGMGGRSLFERISATMATSNAATPFPGLENAPAMAPALGDPD